MITLRGSKDKKYSVSSSISSTLNQVVLRVMGENSSCLESGGSSTKYCAVSKLDSNICWHDIGSPLMFYDEESKWVLYGIASSFAIDSNLACDTTKPSLYTMVPNFLEWIDINMKLLTPKNKGEVSSEDATFFIDN